MLIGHYNVPDMEYQRQVWVCIRCGHILSGNIKVISKRTNSCLLGMKQSGGWEDILHDIDSNASELKIQVDYKLISEDDCGV